MSNPAAERELSKAAVCRPPRANKACVPCRARKAKCDAAVVGYPCSNCTIRQCAADCITITRKVRTRKAPNALTISHAPSTDSPDTDEQSDRVLQGSAITERHTTQSSGQLELDLHYLQILNDAVDEAPELNHTQSSPAASYPRKVEEKFDNSWSTKLSQLDNVDRDYLVKKGVFDLPPPQYLDIFVKIYFNRMYTFIPVIDRTDFVGRYKSGNCSLLLLRAMMAIASIHAPPDVLTNCGFPDRTAAQESLFSRAGLLYDTATEEPLMMLQASIMLIMVLLDRKTYRDYGYWFHAAIGLATKLNLRDIVLKDTKPCEALKLYRRIWWTLYTLDVFHIFIDTKRSRILEDDPRIQRLSDADWEEEEISRVSLGLLSPITAQQKASRSALGDISRIFAGCLSIVKTQSAQDPRPMMQPVDVWRASLPFKTDIDGDSGSNVLYLSILAMSYRYECILFRLIRRVWQKSGHAEWIEWAKQRLRMAILELDTIIMKVVAGGALQESMTPLVTTITTLLALHIESALDPAATQLTRSMSSVSISQMMLVLRQGREIPALKRALPIFESILTKNDLYMIPRNSIQESVQQQPLPAMVQVDETSNDINSLGGGSTVPLDEPSNVLWPSLESWNNDASLQVDMDFLGFEFLDGWQAVEQMDFSG